MRIAELSFVAVAAWFALFAGHGPARAAPVLESSAPPLVATTLDGETFDLAKANGRVVLVTYWATWCAPCKKEMPLLNAFFRAHHDDGLDIISISVDREEDFDRMRRMSRTLSYPTAIVSKITSDGFGPPEGFPLTYVIDRKGIVRDKFIDIREQLLREVVLPLLQH